MLDVVDDDADQPDAEGDGRIPALVHDPVEVGIRERPQECERHRVNGVEVVAKRLGVNDYGRHLWGRMAETGVSRIQREPESIRPSGRHPDLLTPGDAGDVIVLDAGEVPDQPPDRVRLTVETSSQLIPAEAVDDAMHDVTYPPERICENLGAGHPVDIVGARVTESAPHPAAVRTGPGRSSIMRT